MGIAMGIAMGVRIRERYSNKEEAMACRFDGAELCGHKVCEDDYEITEQELEEIGNIIHVNFKQIMVDKLMATGYAPVYETKVIYVDFSTRQKIGHVS